MSAPVMSPPRKPEREPVAWKRISAIIAIAIATAVPLSMLLGFDVCTPLAAVGVELDACARVPAPAPSPGDAGVEQ